MSNTIQIAKRFKTVLEAVEAAVAQGTLDISYNPTHATQKARSIDFPYRGGSCLEALLSDTGDVYYIYKCDIVILHKFEPFSSCLDNSAFKVANIGETEIEFIDGLLIPKSPEGRKTIASLTAANPKLVAA